MKELTAKTFTTKNFDKLKEVCEKIISVSNENVDGDLMAAQLMCLGEAIKEFTETPIVKSSGIIGSPKNVEISEETLNGLYLVLCGVPYGHPGAEVYEKAHPVMEKAHKEILKMGEERGFDCRGGDL